jgi:hypothetical protein
MTSVIGGTLRLINAVRSCDQHESPKCTKEACFPQLLIAHNQIMNASRTQILSYIGSSSGSSTAWAQYFSVGTSAITATTPSDTGLVNELFRKAPASYSTTCNEVDINVQFGSTDAWYVYTNCGIWGGAATSTPGSSTLETNSLFSFTNGSQEITIDYTVALF